MKHLAAYSTAILAVCAASASADELRRLGSSHVLMELPDDFTVNAKATGRSASDQRGMVTAQDVPANVLSPFPASNDTETVKAFARTLWPDALDASMRFRTFGTHQFSILSAAHTTKGVEDRSWFIWGEGDPKVFITFFQVEPDLGSVHFDEGAVDRLLQEARYSPE